MPRVGAQPLKGSPALCHVKTCSGKMGKPFLCIPSFWFQCRPTATTQKAGFNLSTHHEIAFLDASPGVSMGHFGIVCGYLYDFQVLWPEPFNPPWLSQHLPPFWVEIAWKAGYSTPSPISNGGGGLKLAI